MIKLLRTCAIAIAFVATAPLAQAVESTDPVKLTLHDWPGRADLEGVDIDTVVANWMSENKDRWPAWIAD